MRVTSRQIALLFTVALCVAGCATSRDRDPVLGTWELDASKSSFDPGPPVKSQIRTYEDTPAGVKFTLSGISAAGAPMHTEYTAAYDGRDHPVIGAPSVNSVSLKRRTRFRTEGVEKKDGRVVFVVSRVVSNDGSTMTVTVRGTNGAGTAINNVLVFHRI